jgi:tRNA threonylcarbamoyladenosine biosynthesis protein TsaB
MTTVLGIATATDQVGVALGGPEGPIASLQIRQGRRHAELLAPAIETIRSMAGINLVQIGRVAVDVGPGLFTGLRVGVATAKALAAAMEIPIVGCSSLDLLAHPHRRGGRPVAAVVDARRGEVFWALYQPDTGPEMRVVVEAGVSAPADLAAALKERAGEGPVLAVGDGAHRYADVLAGVPGLEWAGPAHDHPSAAVLVELSDQRAAVPLAEITPRYLRGADVRIGWEQRPPAAAGTPSSQAVGRG